MSDDGSSKVTTTDPWGDPTPSPKQRKPVSADLVAERLRTGHTRPSLAKTLEKHYGHSAAEASDLLDAAEEINRQLREQAANVPPDIDLAHLERGAEELAAKDVVLAHPQHVARLAEKLRTVLPGDTLETYNKTLRLKAPALSYEDIAFIGAVHRHNVTSNVRNGDKYRGTSPFSAIAKAAVTHGHQAKPFENRQIRYALDILTRLKFTHPVAAGRKGVSGAWGLSDHPFWTSVFES